MCKAIEQAIAEFPAEFKLKDFSANNFRISPALSYVDTADDVVILYTEIQFPQDKSWMKFSRYTVADLDRQIIRPVDPAIAELERLKAENQRLKAARIEKAIRAKNPPRPPSVATMTRWVMGGVAKATDGCLVEPDGTCQHGKQSWLLVLGVI